jgi:hypothetical protein
MPPRASAIAPTLDKAAMSAPVKARPEPAAPVKARPELAAQVELATSTVIVAESPEPPVATMGVLLSGVAFDGIVTVVGPKSPAPEPVEFAYVVIVDTGVLCSVKVIDSPGSKLVPLTVKDPPSTEHPSLTLIPTPTGGYWPNAAVDHPKVNPRPTTVATVKRFRFIEHPFGRFVSCAYPRSQQRELAQGPYQGKRNPHS